MKNVIRAAAIASLISLTACGGATSDAASGNDDLTSSFDPVAQFAAVQRAASQYTSGIVAVSLSGQREAAASLSKSSCSSFAWVWTVMGSDGMFVDVQVNASGVKVLAHEHRMLFAGEGTFDPTTLVVDAQDVLSISSSMEQAQPTSIQLSAGLAQELTGPHWAVTYPENESMTIDALTGQTSN